MPAQCVHIGKKHSKSLTVEKQIKCIYEYFLTFILSRVGVRKFFVSGMFSSAVSCVYVSVWVRCILESKKL